MEAMGLVLGSLPMAIQAFQTYRTILLTMKNTQRDLDAMIRDLKTEVVILQNTCEILLNGIAPDSEIESLIKDPFGEPWMKYNDEVNRRMGRSKQLFQDRLEDMRNATAELRGKLAINDEGRVSYATECSYPWPPA